MEKHFLRFFATGKKLHVIENQQIHLKVKILEILNLVILKGIQKLGSKIILINIQNNFSRHVGFYLITDRLHQVRFSNPNASVKHEWVERRSTGLLCNRNAR